MMLRSSDNTDKINEEYHDPTGLETPSRAQLPRMLSMTLAEFDERVAEAIRAQTQNLVTSSTANRPNVPTPNRPRRGSHAEEATPPRQTLAEVSASGLSYNAELESVLELKRLKLDLALTTSSEMDSMRGSWARLGVSSPVGSWYSSLFWSVLSDDRSIMADLRYLFC